MSRLTIGMGFHTSTNCFCNGIGDYLAELNAGGNAITAKSVDATASLMDYQRLITNGARGVAVYRCMQDDDVPNYGAPIEGEASKYLSKLNEHWPPELDKSLFYIELINEPDKNAADWIGWFLCELGQQMMDQGYRFCGPGWSAGEPEPSHNRTPGMLAWFEFCSAHRGDLAHAVHEYAFDNSMASQRPWLMGRVGDVNRACKENGIALPDILITEFGWSYQTAPEWQEGVPQIIDQLDWYLLNTPNVKACYLWALDKDPKWANIADTINPYMIPLVNEINSRSWIQPDVPELPVDPLPKIVVLKLAQNHTETAWGAASLYAYGNYKRTITASHDDMLTMIAAGNTHSYAIIADPGRPSQVESIKLLINAGLKYDIIYIEDKPPTPRLDILEFQPCNTERITQHFANDPDYYQQFGLPGHEGIDYGVAYGLPYYAAQSGTVVWASNLTGSGNLSNYGWHVYLEHNVDGIAFHTLYAHAQQNLPVAVGDDVPAGHIVGYSGNSGLSTGPHLHFGVLWPTDTGNGYPMWRFGQCIDPLPYLEDKSPPPDDRTVFNMIDYLAGDGRLYEVLNANGGQERFQTQWITPDEFLQTKNQNAEEFFGLPNFICRGWDTSPGDGRFYQQQEPRGSFRARWLPAKMQVGDIFEVSLWVQFYNWDCTPSVFNTGAVTDTRKFIKWHEVWTSRAGITLDDVIQIEWINGGETYFYAREFGLVGWERTHQDPNTPVWSAISEIHEPGQRPANEITLPACLT